MPARRQTRDDVAAFITVAEELGLPFDRNAKLLQPRDQQPLVLVLGKDLQEGIRSEIGADLFEIDPCSRLAFDPKPDGRDFVAALDNVVREIELPVKFERARVHREGA